MLQQQYVMQQRYLMQQAYAQQMNGYGYGYDSMSPYQAENGDFRNFDNDFDGRREPNHVQGYYRRNGDYTRGHYRAVPRW